MTSTEQQAAKPVGAPGNGGPPWANRIVGYGEAAPGELTAHDKNWRRHPVFQRDALRGVLNQVGVVQNIIVNRRSGKIVDGHLRVDLAIEEKQPSVPVTYVDLAPDEEALILASLDPLSAMAGKDEEILRSLVVDLPTIDDAALLKMLGGNGHQERESKPGADESEMLGESYQILIACTDEDQQTNLLQRLTDEGIKCRALIS